MKDKKGVLGVSFPTFLILCLLCFMFSCFVLFCFSALSEYHAMYHRYHYFTSTIYTRTLPSPLPRIKHNTRPESMKHRMFYLVSGNLNLNSRTVSCKCKEARSCHSYHQSYILIHHAINLIQSINQSSIKEPCKKTKRQRNKIKKNIQAKQ